MNPLAQREEKVRRIKYLKHLYPNQSILSIRLNIPGPVKKGEWSKRLFEVTQMKFSECLNQKGIRYEVVESQFSDRFYEHLSLWVCDASPESLKLIAIAFEENDDIGRFVDIDVLGTSRSQIGSNERKCYLCNDLAFNCARSKKHQVSELIQFMVLKTERL